MLHGGEPLLLGRDRLRGILRTLRSWIDPVAQLDLRIHTNGVLLNQRLCTLFSEYAVRVEYHWTAIAQPMTCTGSTPTGGAAIRRSGRPCRC